MARRRVRVKPGKTQSAMGFVMGIVFVLIGLFMVIPVFGLFGLLWTGMAVVITVLNGLNAFGKKGVPTMEIYSEEEDEPLSPAREDHDHIPSTALTPQERRVDGYLAERLLGIYAAQLRREGGVRMLELPRVHFLSREDYFRQRLLNAALPPGSRRRSVVKGLRGGRG